MCIPDRGGQSKPTATPAEITDLHDLHCIFGSNPKLAHQNAIYRSRIADDTRTCDIMVYLWRVFEDGDVYCNFQNTDNFPENLNEWHCCWTTKYPGTKKTVDRVVSGGLNHVLEFSPLLEEDSHFD